MPRRPRIFISYRREDSQAVTQLIDFRLRQTFGGRNVFMDVDNIPPGVDFRTHISESIAQCHVLLAIIGDQWLNARPAPEDTGVQVWSTCQGVAPSADEAERPRYSRRLDDPLDFVHVEIAAALERGIRVVPVLVGKSAMPTAGALPHALQKLAYCNAVVVRPGADFHDQVNRLIRALRQERLPQVHQARKYGRAIFVAAIASLLAIAAIVYFAARPRAADTNVGKMNLAPTSPAKAARPKSPTATNNSRRHLELALQTLPSLRGGRWWFDEFPCLTPQVRAILDAKKLPASHSAGTSERAVVEAKRGAGAAAFLLRPNVSEVYENLRQCISDQAASIEFEPLAAADWNTKDRQLRKSDVEQMLTALARAEQSGPVLHTAALLRQELMKITDKADPLVTEIYQKAIQQYNHENARDGALLGLAALCHADFARFHVVLGKHREAILECKHARRLFSAQEPPLEVPALFDVDVLCAQAAAARMSGDWREGEHCLNQAKAVLKKLDDDHPLKAYVFERTGAYYSDRWRARTAEDYYTQATHLRLNAAAQLKEPFPAFWARHGAALAKRLQGHPAEQEYAQIDGELKVAINGIKSELDRVNLYHGRINNLERAADAQLFAADPTRLVEALADPGKIAQAQADRAKLGVASSLLDDARVDCRKLRDRFTPAQLAVYETRFRAKQVIVDSLGGDLERAAKNLGRLEQAEKKVAGQLYDNHLRIVKQAAIGCLQLAKTVIPSKAASAPATDAKPAHQLLDALCVEQSSPEQLASLNRDDVDLLMLCSALSLRAASVRAASVQPVLTGADDPEVLMRYVQHVRRVSDNEALAYLRRHFDIGMDVELRRSQADLDRVVDWVMEARSGTPVRMILPKTPQAKSVVVFHFRPTSGFALLSPDGSKDWRAVPLAFGWESRGDKKLWRLPDELRAQIEQLPRPVETWYADRIVKLGNQDWTWGSLDHFRLVED